MALAYLLSPTFEIVNSAGKPATGGYIEVYVAGSRVKYYCASDFDGTLHPFRIPLDSLGSNIVLADDSNAYDVYVYNRYGSLLMSRYNVSPGAGGGVSGGSITSSDGSIVVTPTADGVDLKVDAKPPTVMRCTAADLAGDGAFQFSELQRDGTSARVDSYAVKIDEGWWHYDATVRLHWAGEISGTQSVSLYTANGSDSLTFDLSYPHSETVHVSGELKATQDGTAFVLGVLGMPSGMSASMVDFGIHSIVGEGAGGKYTAGSGIVIDEANRVISIDPETVQEKLTAGNNITIDSNNVISTTVDQAYDASSTNAQSGTAVAEAIAAADNLFIALFRVTTIGEVDTAYGQGKDLICRYYSHGHVYSSQLSSLVSGIYTFTTTDGFSDYEFTLSPDGGTGAWSISSRAIPSGTQLVPEATQSDAGEVLTVDQNGVPEWAPAQAPISAGNGIDITNNVVSVDTSVVATQTDLAGKQDIISDLSSIRAGAAAGATAVQDSNYVHTDNNFTDADKTKLAGIQAGAEANVQSDWAESDSSSDSFIRNKPAQTSLVAGANITIVDDAQNNTVTISATGSAQVQADWAETDNTDPSYILNKPSIPVVGTITL